jgi:Leucine-rich repeat (LRR) protein
MRILNSSQNILELDLSFNNISFESMNNLKNIQRIKLEKARFLENDSFEIFLNENLIELDFSQNYLGTNFEKFSIMKNIESLILRKVNLQLMEVINFQKFLKLKKLDLSFNNLTRLNYDSFKNLKILEYLDLSFNQIDFIDGRIFGDWGDLNEKPLRYLNLESNRIKKFENSLFNLVNSNYLILTNNVLITFPLFSNQMNASYTLNLKYLYFNFNKIKSLTYFTFQISSLLLLNFDNNEISTIESNTFEELKRIQILSISNNLLSKITNGTFFNQMKLSNLNLSHNLIEFIEQDSFQNLFSLKMLDLSFNKLLSIENNLFKGLGNLNDLYLLNNFTFNLFNHSFNYLINIGNFYLTRSMIQENKCLFMHSIERELKRNVGNGKYKFFKSINLVSNDFNLTDNEYCELTFNFLQFKIHWNLKFDYENEIFYEKCKKSLIDQKNNFNFVFKKCFINSKFYEHEKAIEKEENKSSMVRVFESGLYFLSMIIICISFLPIFIIVFVEIFVPIILNTIHFISYFLFRV